MYDGWNLVLALLVSATLEETRYNVTPQPALSCDVHGTLFGGEVISGLQYHDEQDRGSRAQPDIVEGLFLPRMQNVCCLQARGKKQRPSYHAFREDKR